MKLPQILTTFALIVGLASTLGLAISLALNITHPVLCWYEPNVLVRTIEISLGLFASIFLAVELWCRITNKNRYIAPQATEMRI